MSTYSAKKKVERYSEILKNSGNVIFHGAPGTGKSYLAKQIAAHIVSGGSTCNYAELSEEQKMQVGFVQFHPGYDYADFVEGLRPVLNGDGTMGFELTDGVLKSFVDRARRNYENYIKKPEDLRIENAARQAIIRKLAENEDTVFETPTKKVNFRITYFDDKKIHIETLDSEGQHQSTLQPLSVEQLVKLLVSEDSFDKGTYVRQFFAERHLSTYGPSYYHALWLAITEGKKFVPESGDGQSKNEEERKDFVFIIDEINRGEISKIFGELFYSIEPGYRGPDGEISTQYSNLHDDPNEKFYIPENVYIIGTMNDIDRSVDSFDFAMRRRFRFIELRAEDRMEMLAVLGDEKLQKEAAERMSALNKAIAETPDLNESYQIGAAYFMKLSEPNIDFDKLWSDYLCPLLQEYVRGMYDEAEIMKRFAKAYGNGAEQ